ncbi:MAG: SRPBCC family protein [Gemmatimonadales bacterium]
MDTGTEMPARNGRERDGTRQGGSNDGEGLARALGWFSIGLGLTQILAPRGVARLIGVRADDDTRKTMIGLGLRELTSGLGILTRPQPAGWVWSRVGGDAMDLALLGSAMKSGHSNKSRVTAATAAVVGVTILDVIAGQRLTQSSNGNGSRSVPGAKTGITHVKQVITVNRSPEEVYTFWRDFENLPLFMEHLESVQVTDDRRSRWKAKAPAGTTVEWDAEITEDRPNELIAWRSVQDADVPNFGSVRFSPAPGGAGTEIKVELRYDPPGGALGAIVAKLFGEEPNQQVKGDLRRFKQVMELGEVVRSDASIHRSMHPAQPSKKPVSLPPRINGAPVKAEGGIQ